MTRITAAGVALSMIATVAACARPGDTPAGTPTRNVTLFASAVAVPPAPRLIPHSPGVVAVAPGRAISRCGEQPAGGPRRAGGPGVPQPTASFSEEQERHRRALAAARSPAPQRAPVPAGALPAAEACIDLLRPELTLLAASGSLGRETLRRSLVRHGFEATVRPDLSFRGAVGDACVYGIVDATGPTFELGPRTTDGSCAAA
ncbi:hypothetical protein Asp14428_47410 [Actinoplanes sp. NBRC 14428]|nr:hypothetical protein Asp14428_47410 [Actinoplanes sp. NBRC 14428]